MSDAQVIERLLDVWDPLMTGLLSGGGIGCIGEYEYYVPRVLKLLQNNCKEVGLQLYRFFNDTGSELGAESSDINDAKNRFFAWSILQIWETHKKSYSNIRMVQVDEEPLLVTGKRKASVLEIIQQILQDWDPHAVTCHWLYGANTLGHYDSAALEILSLFENGGNDRIISEYLESLSYTEREKIGFCFENMSLSEEHLEKQFQKKIAENAYRNSNIVMLLREILNYSRRHG